MTEATELSPVVGRSLQASPFPGLPYGGSLSETGSDVAEITHATTPVPLRTLLDDARSHGFALGYRAAHETAVFVAEALARIPVHEPLAELSPEAVLISPAGGVHLATTSNQRPAHEVYAYQAPEQVKGLLIDIRANLFSLGSILFEVLSGRPLFMRDDAATTMTAVLAGRLPDLFAILPDTPPTLINVLDRLLARDPDERYASVSDLMRDLHEIRLPSGPGSPPSLSMLSSALNARRNPDSSLNGVDANALSGLWADTAPMFSSVRQEDTVQAGVTPERVSWDAVLSVALVSAVIVGLAVFWFLTLL